LILFAKVEDAFSISGRGCVIVFKFLSNLNLRTRDPIQLRTPDGHVRDTHVAGIEIGSGPSRNRSKFAIMMPPDIAKQDAPPGTEMWLLTTELKDGKV
jgi:hypothetical protein